MVSFHELANRVPGLSIPIFGISWNPPKLEKKISALVEESFKLKTESERLLDVEKKLLKWL